MNINNNINDKLKEKKKKYFFIIQKKIIKILFILKNQ